ncbi:MAG TPA: hypothetical protein VNM24_04855 [Burkholderiales bacterium]|jgi:hypothetical protein|nr:hypothetical protein [Burkholderiales bacterium]
MASEETPELKMDPANLYREEIFTDRKAGTIRVMTPVKRDGSADPARKVLYVGEAQLLTPVGALPLAFQIEANSLGEAAEKFAGAASVAVERAVKELQQLRREAASSIVLPGSGGGLPPGFSGPGGLPGGGKIQLP